MIGRLQDIRLVGMGKLESSVDLAQSPGGRGGWEECILDMQTESVRKKLHGPRVG